MIKNNLYKILFFLFLSLIFIFEGSGIKYGREISYFLVLIMPFFLFFLQIVQKKTIVVPKDITLLFLFFIIFSTLSTFLSVNVQKSFEFLFYYISIFLIFIYVYNHKNIVRLSIIFIFCISFIFLTYSLFINYFLPSSWGSLIPARGYQYVYSFYKTHNPLGPLLLVPIILSLSLYLKNNKKRYLLITFTFLPFFLLTFSRSSYLALILGIAVLFINQNNKKKTTSPFFVNVFLFAIVSLCLLMIFSTVKYKNSLPIIKSTNNLLIRIGLNNKTFFGSRDQFFTSALLSIKNRPFFGVGPGNFEYSARKYATKPYGFAETADNIFFEVFSENGIISGIIFFIIIFLIIKRADKKYKSIFITFITILLLFQTDSSQRYYSYYLLFFILAGLLYQEKTHLKKTHCVLAASIFIYLLGNLIFINRFLYSQKFYQAALYFYPLSQETYHRIIDSAQIEKKNYFLIYKKLFNDISASSFLTEYYYQLGNRITALIEIKKSNELDPFNLSVAIKEYNLEKDLNGVVTAKESIRPFFSKIEKAMINGQINSKYRKSALTFCRIIYNKCPYKI